MTPGMKMKPGYRWWLGIVFCLMSHPGWSLCFSSISGSAPPVVFAYPTQTGTISTTASIGTFIRQWDAAATDTSQIWRSDCGNTQGAGYTNFVGTQAIASNPASPPTFNLTGLAIPGIGYSLTSNSSDNEKLCVVGGNNYCEPYNGSRYGPSYDNEAATDPLYHYYRSSSANLKLTFYVIGALTPGSYTIASGTTLGEVRLGGNSSAEAVLRARTSGVITLNVTQPCTVTTTNIAVSLGTQKANQFVNVGDAGPATPFDINLTGCSASSVHITLTGTADPNYTNAATDGVLATTGGSTGVGVQLRRRDTSAVMPLNQDNTWSSNYTSGNLTLPMEARYMKNNEAVTAGQANATATFTMSYP
jgi:type 1 fimbria pilin